MTLQEVLNYFETNYPGSNVVKVPENNPLELLCEIDPSSKHPQYSVAVAAISLSRPHYHNLSVEEYEVISGALMVDVGGVVKTLYEHEKISIPIRKVHSATSIEGYALVKVTSQPGWTLQDHIEV